MSVSTNIKVDNCPFCGGKSKVYAYLGKFYAKCIKCKTYSAPYDTPEEAAAAWNTRCEKGANCYINGDLCNCTQYPEYARTNEQGKPLEASEI